VNCAALAYKLLPESNDFLFGVDTAFHSLMINAFMKKEQLIVFTYDKIGMKFDSVFKLITWSFLVSSPSHGETSLICLMSHREARFGH
jgi:hypothetical protein